MGLIMLHFLKSDCLREKARFVDHQVDKQLCAKMYREAQVLAKFLSHGQFTMFADLLSEHSNILLKFISLT